MIYPYFYIIIINVNRSKEIFMFYQSKEIFYDNRTFLVKFRPYWEGKMCEVKLYELKRPNWKFFKYSFLDIYYFWVEEYESINEGLHHMVINYWKHEASDDIIKKKWDNI